MQADVPVSIRINEKKGTPAPLTAGAPCERVAWCETGYYLPERLSFTFDPLFHAGAYYVQEASSMFLEQAIRSHVKTPVRCLDLCAAPGGKSTHLAACLPEGSLLVSNEVIRSRSHILAENIAKWGNPNCIVTNNYPKEIIHDVWNALKPGGLLIYSTCTYNMEEDEENIHYITEELGAEALSIPVKDEWQITGPLKYDHPVYRFFPHKTKGEGFFLAALRKADGETEEIRFKNKNKKEKGKTVPAVPEAARAYLLDTTSFTPEWSGSTLWMLPEPVRDVYPLLREHLRILSAGICMGEAKGKDFIPAEELALSTGLRREAFPTVDLDWEDAIRYLKKEALLLPDSTEKGYVLICHKGFPLGFAKHLGNRANNLYPQEWRIRTGYVPEKVKTFEMKV